MLLLRGAHVGGHEARMRAGDHLRKAGGVHDDVTVGHAPHRQGLLSRRALRVGEG